MEHATARAQLGSPLSTRGSTGAARRGARAGTESLSSDERGQVIDTFVELLEGLYTHLPLKRARYAIDPLQRLRLLRQRVATIDDDELHAQLPSTLTSLRDAHTRYIGPSALEGKVATLPFLVEAYGKVGHRRYVVSKIAKGSRRIDDPHFVAGVELLHWNAVPVDRAVDLHAERETGGRPDARRSRALESLTFRALQYGPPPDEDWIVVGYRDLDGTRREVRVEWRVVTPGRARTATPGGMAGRAVAVDAAAEMTRRVKKLMFAPELWAADRRARARPVRDGDGPAGVGGWLDTEFQDVVAAKAVETRHGRFGYLRLWSFDVADDAAFVDDVIRLLSLLPGNGLIVDLRGNPGGLVWAAERLLQLFTPHPVATTRFSMVATALTRAMAAAAQNAVELEPWGESLERALATGDIYSHAVPLTPPDRANDIGQVYGGPVVAVVDANTYSSGDLFAAGFVDNDIGTLVGVDEATGGGGANVWEPADVHRALVGTTFEPRSLPGGVGYTVAVRRATRSGAAQGGAIEDVGVRGHEVYPMTKRDLTGDNRGLFNFCGALLRDRPRTGLQAGRSPDDPSLLVVATTGLDRLDVVLDGRPRGSLDLAARDTSDVVLPAGTATVELLGYLGGELVQRRVIRC